MALNITSGIIDIPQGGTNAGTAPAARVNLLPALAGNAGRVLAVNAGATDVEYIPVVGGGGTVTSVGLSAPDIFTVTNSPITTNGTLTLSYSGTALPIANGGTGATTAALARTALGATVVGSNLFTLTDPTAVTFIRINADNTISALDAATFRTAIGAGTSSTVGTVTSVGGTGTVSGLTLSGTVTSSGNLTLGGTLAVTASNFASQTANTFLAAPNGASGVPTFRALVAADVPTLNQNTTGSAATLTTARTINGVSFNGSANILVPSIYDSTYRRITNPGGGQYITSTASITGALAIALPTAVYGQSKMITFRVTVYEYLTGESIEVQVSGYQYSVGNWLNMSGYILAQSNINRNYSIRFAKDTTNLRYVVYIGELATTWDYPQVFITDVQNGYGSNEAGWESGWSIYFESTAFATVAATISNPQIGYSATTNTANALVLRDGSGNFSAGTITATLSGNATNVTGTVAIANGGTGATTTGAALTALGAQAALVSGTNIKTINSTSLLGSGDIAITSTAVSETISIISTNTTAVRYTTYACTAALTLTLPASPTAGDWVQVSNRSTVTTIIIGRNAQNIMGLAEDMTLNILNASVRLVFADATRGWIIV